MNALRLAQFEAEFNSFVMFGCAVESGLRCDVVWVLLVFGPGLRYPNRGTTNLSFMSQMDLMCCYVQVMEGAAAITSNAR